MQLEYALRTEIEFWRDLIETSPAGTGAEAVDEMFRAKALVEKKLDLLLRDENRTLN